MRKLLIVAMVGTSLVLSGCVISVDGKGEHSYQSDWQDKEQKNRRIIAKLEPKLSKQEVSNQMGVPDFSEYYEQQGQTFHVLYYRTQRVEGDGVTTKDECTPLIFQDNVLIGWGDSAYKIMKN